MSFEPIERLGLKSTTDRQSLGDEASKGGFIRVHKNEVRLCLNTLMGRVLRSSLGSFKGKKLSALTKKSHLNFHVNFFFQFNKKEIIILYFSNESFQMILLFLHTIISQWFICFLKSIAYSLKCFFLFLSNNSFTMFMIFFRWIKWFTHVPIWFISDSFISFFSTDEFVIHDFFEVMKIIYLLPHIIFLWLTYFPVWFYQMIHLFLHMPF